MWINNTKPEMKYNGYFKNDYMNCHMDFLNSIFPSSKITVQEIQEIVKKGNRCWGEDFSWDKMFLNQKGAFIYYSPTDLGFRSTFPCAPILRPFKN